MEEFTKKYYKIKDVSEMLDIPASTLRYWESEFPECKPRRSATNIRYYTPEDIETLQIIRYLVKDKGLRIEAAKEEMRNNRKNVSRRVEVISKLTAVRDDLQQLLSALNKRR